MIQIKNYLESVTSKNQEKLNLLAVKVTIGHIGKVGKARSMLEYNLHILLQGIINAREVILQPNLYLRNWLWMP
jgi:hypothetical protein